jgi:histone H4
MENFKKPAITRVARRAGIKNISDESYTTIRNLIVSRLTSLLEASFIVNEQSNTKTLMTGDVIEALRLQNINLSRSALSTDSCPKF